MNDKLVKPFFAFFGAAGALTILFVCIVLTIYLRDDKPKAKKATIIQKVETDGWILIGDKDGCKLYRKAFEMEGFIYWTICKSGVPVSTSISK